MNQIVEALGLGQPIGTTQTPHSATDRGMDDDEHGAGTGTGVAGGGTRAGANADVYQAGGPTDRSNSGDGFSAGLSGDHSSGGIPHHGTSDAEIWRYVLIDPIQQVRLQATALLPRTLCLAPMLVQAPARV